MLKSFFALRFATLIVLAIFSAAAFASLYTWIFEGDALVVKNIFVVETERIKPDQIRAYLEGYVSKPLYGVDLSEIGRVVEQHPWVKHVVVRRMPPHQIVVEPVERKAIAVLDSKLLLDEDGIPFLKVNASEAGNWPLVKAKERRQSFKLATDAILSYSDSSQRALKIAKVLIEDDKSVDVIFENGLFVELGNDKFSEKWQKLDAILNHLHKDGLHPDYIYLGNYPNPQQVAVKLRMDNDSRGMNGSIETR
jgi:cell division septal protein FtsQ